MLRVAAVGAASLDVGHVVGAVVDAGDDDGAGAGGGGHGGDGGDGEAHCGGLLVVGMCGGVLVTTVLDVWKA